MGEDVIGLKSDGCTLGVGGVCGSRSCIALLCILQNDTRIFRRGGFRFERNGPTQPTWYLWGVTIFL